MENKNFSASIDAIKVMRDFTYENKLMIDFDIDGFLISVNDDFGKTKINNEIKQNMKNFYLYCANNLFKDAVKDYKNSIQAQYPFNGYGAMQTYTITYNQNCILSYYVDEYQYTGGAHGITMRTSSTNSLINGQKFSLQNFFKGNFKTIIMEEIEKQATELQKDGLLFDDYEKLIVKNFNQNSFYLNDSGIVIYYQQYDIAPYAAGILEFTIPYSMVDFKPKCWQV